MKVLILNSGIGRRMEGLTQNQPKCMVSIDDQYTILGWQLELLKRVGLTDIVITTGPFAKDLQDNVLDVTSASVSFVHNPRYRETNYIYSMYLARDLLDDDLIILHGDLVLETSVIQDLMASPNSAAAVEAGVALPDKDFKAKVWQNRILKISVDLFGDDCVACQPAYKLLRADICQWMKEIEKFCQQGKTDVYAENALNMILEKLDMRPLFLEGRLCNEVDNLTDLHNVSERFKKVKAAERGSI